MLLDGMVGQDLGSSPKLESLASISEIPADTSGELWTGSLISNPTSNVHVIVSACLQGYHQKGRYERPARCKC
jgi:hypothetical protein